MVTQMPSLSGRFSAVRGFTPQLFGGELAKEKHGPTGMVPNPPLRVCLPPPPPLALVAPWLRCGLQVPPARTHRVPDDTSDYKRRVTVHTARLALPAQPTNLFVVSRPASPRPPRRPAKPESREQSADGKRKYEPGRRQGSVGLPERDHWQPRHGQAQLGRRLQGYAARPRPPPSSPF